MNIRVVKEATALKVHEVSQGEFQLGSLIASELALKFSTCFQRLLITVEVCYAYFLLDIKTLEYGDVVLSYSLSRVSRIMF